MTATQDLFVDDEPAAPAGPPPIILDRSTLERWATCPHQAAQIERGMVTAGGADADSGNAAHEILARACFHRHVNGVDAKGLREFIEDAAVRSRPDVQPDVIAALRRAFPVAQLLCSHSTGTDRAPEDLLRYDGGSGEHAGQIAGVIVAAPEDGSRGPVLLTCELDLLLASKSAEELELVDWKSGRRHWTATDVEESFQFQFYSWLIFYNYPTVNRVSVRVFLARDGLCTSAVEFTRERHVWPIQNRLLSAVELYLQHNRTNVLQVPAWPSPDKCSLCPVANLCATAHAPERDLAVDPEGYLRQYVVLRTAAAKMKRTLTAARKKRGKDFDFGDVKFGSDKPKTPRAAVCDVYGGTDDGDDQ